MKQKDCNDYSLFLALGSNLGERERIIEKAYELIEEQIGIIHSKSAFFYSTPVDFISDNNFVNSVCEVITNLNIYDAFSATQNIEYQLGRMGKSKNLVYSDRFIDIDLILAGDLIINNENLIIPHPRFHHRNFVLLPLFEIAPDVLHPILKKSIRELKFDFDQI